MRFSILAGGNRHYSYSCVIFENCSSCSFWVVFSLASYTCVDQYPAEHSMEDSADFQSSLSVQLSSSVLCPANSRCLGFPDSWLLHPIHLAPLGLQSPTSLPENSLQAVNWAIIGLSLFISCFSVITVLRCMVSNV